MKTKQLSTLTLLLAGSTLLTPAAPPPIPEFQQTVVDDNVAIGYGIAIGDVDGDQKPDILLADKNQFVWYQNPGWKKHLLAENLTQRDNVCIAARDIDGDGRVEIAVGGEWNPGDTLNSGSVHYLVPPEDRTRKWTAIQLPNEPTVHRMRWMRNWRDEFELVVLPLHGRDNKNGQGAGVKMLAYLKPENPANPWPTRELCNTLHQTHNLDPIQWDDDPAEEPLLASAEGIFVVNYQDDRLQTVQITSAEGGGAGEVRLGKLKNGGRFIAALEPMHGNEAVIYQPSNSKFWSRKVIDSSFAQGHAVACADILGIGSDQVVVGWRNKNKEGKVGIVLFTPMNDQADEWRKSIVDDNTMATEDLQIADLNGDGRLDIVAAGRATKNLKIYFSK